MNDMLESSKLSAEPVVAQPSGPTVLVLGATGFIGQALVKRLLQDGLRVRALVRRRGSASLLAQQGVEWVNGDLTDSSSVKAATLGVQHVYHLASGRGPTWDDYVKLYVEPTRRLAELCCKRGIVLHYASSIAIYDGSDAAEVITEATPPSPAALRLNLYARAKMANENWLTDMHRRRGLKVVVYRPGIVIGAGGNPHHPGVGAWPNAVTCRPWGGGDHRLPFVLVDDCADAMARALHKPEVAGQSFNLVGYASLTGNEYLDALQRTAATTIKREPLPAWRLFAQSVVKWALNRQAQRPERPLPSYRYGKGLSCLATYSTESATRQLGWESCAYPSELIARGIVLPAASPHAGLPN
jgi:nucleoside-diphosphate-sugar epimerase